uniref:Golgin B1 n=1 Tax=Sphenodon punctatus TaxID=8508 RepID=A0A8D0L5A6_SPHPU
MQGLTLFVCFPPLFQANAGGSPEGNQNEQPAPESVSAEAAEYLAAKKHTELSILLLELREAQEEIAFLKGQMHNPDSQTLVGNGAEEEAPSPPGERSQVRFLEEDGKTAVCLGSSLLVGVAMQGGPAVQEETTCLPGIPAGQAGSTPEETEAAQASPAAAELERLQLAIVELQSRLREAEESYQRKVEEKEAEITRLHQGTKDSESALAAERDGLLSQLKDLCPVTELKEQVRQLEANLVDSEKQRLSDHESRTGQRGVLEEQIQSLKNEGKSKEVKIGALQKDLDAAQGQLSEQEGLTRRLRSQLQEEDQEMHALASRLQESMMKVEELSQSVAAKELETARLEQLLARRAEEVESLQRTVAEKDQQMTEISVGMSEKMVQLNEEKFSLGNEIKSLKEQLKTKGMRDQHTGMEGEAGDLCPKHKGPAQQQRETAAAAEPEEEVKMLQEGDVKLLQREGEQVKKKLQAALVSRKELLQKVSKLEKELARARGESGAPGEPETEAAAQGTKVREESAVSSPNAEGRVTPESQARAVSLNQQLFEKELELQSVCQSLQEKESAVVQLQTVTEELQAVTEELQAVTEELKQSLQEKTSLVDSLKAKIAENPLSLQKLTTVSWSTGELDPSVGKEVAVVDAAAAEFEAEQRLALEEKISALEQERDQLQKKLQEAVAARKDTVKKAQEKDRHHREQLKQVKDDYNLLQEEFEKQIQETKSIRDQLEQLQAQRKPVESHSLPALPLQGPAESTGAGQDSGRSQDWGMESSYFEVEASMTNGNLVPVPDDNAEQLRVELGKLQAERNDVEAKVGRLEEELACKSEVVLQLQEHTVQLLAEVEALRAACRQAEANEARLQLELEEVSQQDSLLALQSEIGELKQRLSKKDEDIEALSLQLRDKDGALANAQAELLEKESQLKALRDQLESRCQVHEEQSKRLQTELLEVQQRSEEAEEARNKNQMQRKLQAALISRKEALKESKALKEELAAARITVQSCSVRLADAEGRLSDQEKDKEALSEKLADLKGERERLIAEVDRALLENQNLDSSCESLKLPLEGMTQEKETLVKEVESAKSSQAATSSEWQERHVELQREYETLLQSYENVSNEAERIQRVLEGVRQEKQEVFLKLKGAEAEKRELEKQLQEAEQEREGMKEKMRKFAKSKQQKILELEEENERLRAEAHLPDSGPGKAEETSTQLSEELKSSRREQQALATQLKGLMAEKESLNQEILDLRQQLLKASGEAAGRQRMVEEEAAAEAEQAVPVAAAGRVGADNDPRPPEHLEPETEQAAGEGGISHDEINTYFQQIARLTDRIQEMEEKRTAAGEELDNIRRSFEALGEEKTSLESQAAAKDGELDALRETVARTEQTRQETEEQLVRAMELKEALEAEKDDLEERLMNQLAELNGSIGNYQQDLADWQSRNEGLQAELERLQRAASQLEEEKRQLVREKTEAESETRREYAEKVRCAQKGDGSRTHAKELQELLKEKQQEVKQLQKDCIKSQERISSLERTIKALEFVQSESQKELEAAKKDLARADEGTKKAQAELASCRILLDDTQGEAARVLAESLRGREALQASKELGKNQLKQKEEEFERRLEREREKHTKELKNMEEKLETLQRERERGEGTLRDTQNSLHKKEQEAQQLQGSLNQTLAQLAAFTRSMSSLQDDRDRVIDQSKQWEKKFSEAIRKKEEEIQAREETCTALRDQVKEMTMHVEELQINLSRLERSKQAWESKSQQEAEQNQKLREALQEETQALASQLEASQRLHGDSQSELRKAEEEAQRLREQLADLQGSFAEGKAARAELESTVKQQEADLQNYRFTQEQLEADLLASKELTDRLHEEMGAKEQKIIGLLSAKEEAVATAVSELQQQHGSQVKELEGVLARKEEEKAALESEKTRALEKLNQLTEKLKLTREESKQHKAQLDSFTKSMSSLQDDRDRVLSDYKRLEERHLAAILEKDQLIQEAAAENNELKEEIRGLHGRMDDLHSENAKLDAELVRYREDLNQVISIKDSQLKQLLKTQLQRIQVLEKEKASTEGQLRESEHVLEELRLSAEALQKDKGDLAQETETLTASLGAAQREMAALREGGPLEELQAQLMSREEELRALSSELSRAQQRVADLEEELARVQKSTAQQAEEAEAKLRKELKHLHHDAGIMRNETETAEERVAELARDLMGTEQNLLAVTEENKDLRAQLLSFGNAMSSLQDSWDQANEELRGLEKKHSAELAEQQALVRSLQEEQSRSTAGRDLLAAELAALKKAADERGLFSQFEKQNQQLQAKEEELQRLALELEGSASQVKSFSKAMASLQDERDRLLGELDRSRKVEEGKQQQLAAAASDDTSPAEVQSLKKALSSLQNDRARLLAELKSLQQRYLQVGVDTGEIDRLKAQLEEHRREVERQQGLWEQQRQESLSYQEELAQLRQEKAAWEAKAERVKEQYLVALADKDQQLGHLQRIVQEMRPSLPKTQVVEELYQRQAAPETAGSREALGADVPQLEAQAKRFQAQLGESLKELHQKELRIQQLNSKLSQVFEEKNALSLQLRGSSRSLRESQQLYSEVCHRCLDLEKRLQEAAETAASLEKGQQPPSKNTGSSPTDAAPGAPQEKNQPPSESYTPELQELQQRLSEAKHLQSSTRQDLRHLEEQLEEERQHRLAAEETCAAAQEEIQRLESLSEWAPAPSTSIDMTPSPEHALLIGPTDSTFSKARGSSGTRRLLRSLFCSRRRLPLLVTVYLLALHVLLVLCFTGQL